MKKLLLVTTLLAAISATAMAGSAVLGTAVTDSLTVTAKYVKPMTVSLDTTSIDFGDVYTDSTVVVEDVVASITGEVGETFGYTVTSNGAVVALTGDTSGSAVAFVAGAATLTFGVGLDTTKLTADTDVSEIVTISVTYDAIDETNGVI